MHDEMVAALENGLDKPSLNSGRGCLHFTLYEYPWERHEFISSFWLDK